MIVCQMCRFEAKSLYGLARHLTTYHNQNHKEYYDKYLKKEDDEICCTCKKESTKFCSFTNGYTKYCSQICAWKDSNLLESRKQTYVARFGVDHPSKNREVKKKISIQSKKNWEKQYSKRIDMKAPFCARIGIYESKALDTIELYINTPIRRGIFLSKYFVDGLLESLNIIFEFDESHHFNKDGTYIKSDNSRQKDLEDMGYRFFRIKQTEWNKNENYILKTIKEFVNG